MYRKLQQNYTTKYMKQVWNKVRIKSILSMPAVDRQRQIELNIGQSSLMP
jgi:hypothetical protein